LTRVLVIINPVSGPTRRGSAAQRVARATRGLERLGAPANIRLTERMDHAHELAMEAAASDIDLVIAWGGDGTINEVGRALVQRADEGAPSIRRRTIPALGIIPGGSGNGLARALGIPFNPEKAIEHAIRAPDRQIDVGELGDRMFFNVAGVGLDAHVAALVSTHVHHRGLAPYLKGVVGDLLRYKPVEYAVTADGRSFQASALFIAVANSRQYGFGVEIAPRASLEDGMLDVVVVEDRRFIGNLARIPSLFLRNIDRRDGIDASQVRSLTIRCREPMLFHVDGEAVQGSDTLVARVHPGALRLKA
jgi:YegS/Rv2252/BmrU family lipid kinase